MPRITICNAQRWVKNAWKLSPKKDIQEKDELLFFLEEIGEIARAVRVINGRKDGNISKEDLEKEFGDVLLSLLTLANRYNIDLEKGFQKSKAAAEKRYVERKG